MSKEETMESTDRLFVRVATHPDADLARGRSYSMGCLGDEDQAHAGLSCYSLADGIDYACERIERRMGFGRYTSRDGREVSAWVVLLAGRHVGGGPENEDLCEPARIVAKWDTREVRSADDLATKIRLLGIRDDEE